MTISNVNGDLLAIAVLDELLDGVLDDDDVEDDLLELPHALIAMVIMTASAASAAGLRPARWSKYIDLLLSRNLGSSGR